MLAHCRDKPGALMSSSAASPHTLVLGLGATGVATIDYLAGRSAHLTVADTRADPPGLAAVRARHAQLELRLGEFAPELLEGVDQVVVSPGLPADLPLLAAARDAGIPVLGDIELFARAVTQPVVAVTGSNGKSTVTTLVAQLLQAAGIDARAGGNLGPPALALLDEAAAAYVLELSSFQLEMTQDLHCRAATVLNVSADHMDRHGDVARYAAIKEGIFRRADVAVINRDDALVRPMAAGHPHRVTFGLDEPGGGHFGVRTLGGVTWLARGERLLVPATKLRIKGPHNIANGLAALALVQSMGVEPAGVLEALQNFPGLAHRCEWVGEWRGVTWVNDSKGTNVGATVAALQGLQGPLVLIAGGVGKDADFGPLAAAARGRVKAAVLLGRDAALLAGVLAPICPVTQVGSMADAVAAARQLAGAGDTVLLSPACASLDMYADFAARGDDFRAAVLEVAS